MRNEANCPKRGAEAVSVHRVGASGRESITVRRPHSRRLEIAFSRRAAILWRRAWTQAHPTS